ncbi:hypothetical protein EMGBS1_04300 [Chloroflexota bacterium]|nr:hypothetical protein EMGBS1_04300 [Chloroflexota bacterium]
MSTPTKSRLLRGRGFLLAPIALIVLYYGAYFFFVALFLPPPISLPTAGAK